ncbi:MAG: hypothetical protein JSS65_06035 [Armatimonadetes bacterium]|nr:hypothetical protein [Armatimonadota bacterium]
MRVLSAAAFVGVACLAWAQGAPATPAPASTVDVAQILKTLTPRELGPTTMGGRISDFGVYEKDPRIFYVASASGGLWKTVNAGLTFAPTFTNEAVAALGAVAVNQNNPDDVWVGTGEQNSRNSTSWGGGVYRSKDGGKTWTYLGLKETKHISHIVIDPKNPDTVYVGALGHLWGENEERGLYKTTDGGKNWTRTLAVDKRTGVIELQMDPKNPNNLMCAMFERFRWPYRFASGGPGSAMYRSTDAGKTWHKVTKGLPTGTLGRIGISYYRKNPRIVAAVVEATEKGGVYRSEDGGESWTFMSNTNPRPFYFSQIRIDPNDDKRIYLGATNFHVSDDMGKTFRAMNITIHVDFHAIWIDPANSNHFLVGEDGGVGITWDKGDTWQHANTMRVAQFYAVAVDNRKPYYVYGGLQDNGTWAGPTQTKRNGVGFFDWYNVGGGDGFHVQADPEDWRWVYSESQGGGMVRYNQESGETRFIQPRVTGLRPRFNWSTPIILSPHNSATLYVGGNYLFRSVDRGNRWEAVSPDLSTNDPEKLKSRAGVTPEDTGAERHCTITTVSESPLKRGVLWAGTDDGLLHVTEDDGKTWTEVGKNCPGLPKFTWCSRIIASNFVLGRAYATFDGHRNDDYETYVYSTEDFGKTWTRLATNLGPDNSAYVIKEGTVNPSLLVLGTEVGMYVSLDKGANWTKFGKDSGFPTVRVDDVVIHPREKDLVVGTHGRAIWIVPFAAMEALSKENMDKDVFLVPPTTAYLLGMTGSPDWEGNNVWYSQNTQPGTLIYYWLKSDTPDKKAKVTITDAGGGPITTLNGTGNAGLNVVRFTPGRRGGRSGDFTVTLTAGTKEAKAKLTVEDLSRAFDSDINIR